VHIRPPADLKVGRGRVANRQNSKIYWGGGVRTGFYVSDRRQYSVRDLEANTVVVVGGPPAIELWPGGGGHRRHVVIYASAFQTFFPRVPL
jgi:hypothetical protein